VAVFSETGVLVEKFFMGVRQDSITLNQLSMLVVEIAFYIEPLVIGRWELVHIWD
jgi:hypothetical protein